LCVASNLLFVLIKRLQQKKGKIKKMRIISYLGILHAIFIGKTTQNKKKEVRARESEEADKGATK
jgi:hypothetical protein